MDKEALEKIHDIICGVRLPHHWVCRRKIEQVLKVMEELGYRKLTDNPNLREKIGNVLQLICWNLISDSVNCSGEECNKGKGSPSLCGGLKGHLDQILSIIKEEK